MASRRRYKSTADVLETVLADSASEDDERKICLDFYTIRKNIYSSFLRRRMVGGGRPLLPEILGQPTPVGAKSPIFNQ